MVRYYIWFVVVVAGLAGIIRVVLPMQIAELQIKRFSAENALHRARMRSLIIAVLSLLFGSLYFLPRGYQNGMSFLPQRFQGWLPPGHQSWILIGAIFSLLSAAEGFFQAHYPTPDALTFLSRLMGILYLGLAIGSYALLSRI